MKSRAIMVMGLVALLLSALLAPAALADTGPVRVIRFEGTVVSGPVTTTASAPVLGDWVIDVERRTRTVTVDTRTRVIEVHGPLEAGAQVMVVARVVDDETLVALVIKVLPEAPRRVVFRGFVSELDENDPPSYMVVHGREILLTEETEIRGVLREGALVHVVALVEGDQITALKVQVIRIPYPRLVILRGRVQDMDAEPTTYIKVWGLSIQVTAETKIEGELAAGEYVKVKARFAQDGLTATHIEVITRDAAEPEGLPEAVELVAF